MKNMNSKHGIKVGELCPIKDESVKDQKVRLRKIILRLKKMFPNAACSLVYKNPLQLLIATILSAQCTDERVNKVTPQLFRKFPKAINFAEAELEEIEKAIYSTGFFKNKAKSIKNCCLSLVKEHAGMVPMSMDLLIRLSGVGRKTANVVLGNAFEMEEGVVVDTHVRRISKRLRVTIHEDPVKIERDLLVLIPKADRTIFAHLFIRHGRVTCTARSPACEACEINAMCPSKGIV